MKNYVDKPGKEKSMEKYKLLIIHKTGYVKHDKKSPYLCNIVDFQFSIESES